MPQPLEHRLAAELSIRPQQVLATITLLDEGATVPFIARYRKEVTDGLDDTQLRNLAERLVYLRDLDERRESILTAIASLGRLDAALAASIDAADSKQRLEDLYAPFKKKRRTKAQIAREAGLGPLADSLLADPTLDPETTAAAYLKPPFTIDDSDNPGVADAKAALEGARQILMERFAEHADLVGSIREEFQRHGMVTSTVIAGQETIGEKFADYFDYTEKLADVPSHRALALLRGRREQVLRLSLRLPDDLAPGQGRGWCENRIASAMGIHDKGRPADSWLLETARWTWTVKLSLQIESELMSALRERADADAIEVFARNLKALLLAAPAGRRCTMGLDPGLRTGVKVAIVDDTGKLLATDTIYPHPPRNDLEGSIARLAALARQHSVELVAIGNGTGSRPTDRLVADLIARHPELPLKRVTVSEAGASVYSASELAAREFPDLDVSLRGAVSIARRLQDPLAELVKIEPKAIGVGQYQHDVNQPRLARSLDAVVEDCVNGVGVDVNTASVPLLARIAGLNTGLAENIVEYRNTHGGFARRTELLKVKRLGERAFEQSAGFLRIADGENPLDASAVHPEAYPVVEKMLADIRTDIRHLLGKRELIARLTPEKYVDQQFGLPTVVDILKELEKPGRDPRPEFRTASFRDGIESIADLAPGMSLEGVVTNVAAFGAFVDIGVHQDGLVHISMLADHYVADPHKVVKAGDLVKVRVLEVDVKRQRIALTMRSGETANTAPRKAQAGRQPAGQQPAARDRDARNRGAQASRPPRPASQAGAPDSAMALAMAALKRQR